jgi:phage RecT family recombinase
MTAWEFILRNKDKILSQAKRKYDKDTFMASVHMVVHENNDFEKCVQTETGKGLLYGALCRAAVSGLSLNPQEGLAALITYHSNKLKAQVTNYQVMKNGMIELAMETDKISYLTSDVVHKNDHFKLKKTVDGDKFEFEPNLDDRGPARGYMALIVMTDGFTQCEYMSLGQVKEHKEKSSAGRQDSPWEKWFDSMGMKTVIKSLLKKVHIGKILDPMINADDLGEKWSADQIDGKGTTPYGLENNIPSDTEQVDEETGEVTNDEPAPTPFT